MARRRYISTEICTDAKMNQVSDRAALLYTWSIPHTDAGGFIPGDDREIALKIIPGRRMAQITAAIDQLCNAGLAKRETDGIVLVLGRWDQKRTDSGRQVHWRRRVLDRDGHRCQYCGSTEKLVAHHISPWASEPDLRYEVSNGLTLCDRCHRKHHSRRILRAVD